MAFTLPLDVQRFLPNARYSIGHTSYYARIDSIVPQPVERGSQTITSVASYLVSKREIMRSNGAYLNNDMRFSAKLSAFAYRPKPRDTVQCENIVYRIIDVDIHRYLDHCAFTARNLSVAYELEEEVSIWRNVYRDGGGGTKVGVPTNLLSGVLCRFQRMDAGAVNTFGVTELEKRHNVILEVDWPTLRLTDHIRRIGGSVVEIERVLDSDCLDMLSRVEVIDNGARWPT